MTKAAYKKALFKTHCSAAGEAPGGVSGRLSGPQRAFSKGDYTVRKKVGMDQNRR
jgi:hypothetical protein